MKANPQLAPWPEKYTETKTEILQILANGSSIPMAPALVLVPVPNKRHANGELNTGRSRR